MLLNGFEKEKLLFAKSVPISIKDEYTNQTRKIHLFLKMEWQDASAERYSRKVLAISLTDSNDPFFLYNLHLSEEEFQTLKTSQDLLIDFSSFPQHIIDYIDTCLLEEKNPLPKFLLVFSIKEGHGNSASSRFDIIESNKFKHLTHLSLKFVAATDSEVRNYLTTCFKNIKEENRYLQNKLNILDQDLKDQSASYQYTLNSKEQELDLIKKRFHDELTEKDNRHVVELQEERKRLLDRQKEEEKRFKSERKESENHYKRQIEQLNMRADTLDSKNEKLRDEISKLESNVKDLTNQVSSLVEEARKLKHDAQSYRSKYESVHYELQEKESIADRQEKEINLLQQELKNKEQSVDRLELQIEREKDKNKTLDEKMDELKVELEISERKIKKDKKDKDELNRVITNCQERIAKMRAKADADGKYKQMVENKENILQDCRREILDLKDILIKKENDLISLHKEINSLKIKISDLEKEKHSKENMISYLNRQLTDNLIVPSAKNLNISPSLVAQTHLNEVRSSVVPKFSSSTNSPRASHKITPKSVRLNAQSSVGRKNSSTPSRFHMTGATDSAYGTSPLGLTNQMTPDTAQGNHYEIVEDAADFVQQHSVLQPEYEIDSDALSAAFGDSKHILKHSTAKKSSKTHAKSTPARTLKKR